MCVFKVNHPYFVDDTNLIFSSENIGIIESVIKNLIIESFIDEVLSWNKQIDLYTQKKVELMEYFLDYVILHN